MDLCASDVPKTAQSGDAGHSRAALSPPATRTDLVLKAWEANQTDADYPRQRCLHELLAETAQADPNKVAVEFRDQRLTYKELDERSNQLAHFLRRKGIGPESLVGLCVERSLEMVVALVGILKAGGAYVPLDPGYPADRIKYVLDDARVRVLLTHKSLLNSLPETSADVICIEQGWEMFRAEDCGPVASPIQPENLAYVIYTSGSTGRPKGVQLEHRSVVNFLCSMRCQPGMTAEDTLVAVTTLSFDIAGLELYLPLLTGGRLVVAPHETIYDGRLLMQLMMASEATIMQATPTTWRVLFDSGWEGDDKLKVLVGGEALSADLARHLAQSCGQVWNMYGPTETTIWSSVYRVEGTDDRLVPIGKPIANTTFHILDSNRQPVPDGAEGELYIGGEGLARGYFERDEMTADKFISDPFSSQPVARMYRTGDLGRYRADGNVEFLGRIDHQVKIRGFRIELGEVEAVLEQHQGVQQAIVVARENAPGDLRLVAYFVRKQLGSLPASELRAHVGRQLPDYMVPSAYVQVLNFPLTPNGKVDRKQLPAPTVHDFEAQTEYVAPRDEIERKLVLLWEETLGLSPLSVTSNFFDLGGRSVLAAQLFTRVLRTFGKELPLSTLFHSPTVEQLAKLLQPSNSDGEYRTLVTIQPSGTKPPFFCIHGGAGSTLFLHRLARALGPDYPFYGVEPEGMDGKRFQRPTVEQMAEHYLAEIKRVQPVGPYFLGGYCFGGLVAFEIAQLLHKRGEQAALVALFSAELRRNHRPSPLAEEQSKRTHLTGRLARAAATPVRTARNLVNLLYWRAIPATRKLYYQALLGTGRRIPPEMRTMYVTTTLGQAEARYRPKAYSGTLTLFYDPDALEFGPNLGWDGLAEHFERCVIGDGNLSTRREIMNEPLVAITAEKLAHYLNEALGAQLPAALPHELRDTV
ncbi:MAG TPA: amino acid adenylation domain-containing protein [Candidatus Angelobacter sp.]|nr:amino acid adenylation domain-containing protein [Candidatus Angelobacter sp.]